MDRTPIIFVSLVLSLAAATAHADTDEELLRQKTTWDFQFYDRAITAMQDSHVPADRTAESCIEAIDRAHAAGLTDSAKLYFREQAPLGAMKALCSDYAAELHLSEAYAVITETANEIADITAMDLSHGDEDKGAAYLDQAAHCSKEVDRLIAAGLAADTKLDIEIDGKTSPVIVGEAKAKVCANLAKLGATFSKKVAVAYGARQEALAAPYKKAGISGDRLELCMHYDGWVIRGAGAKALSSPGALKSASILFVLSGPSTDTGLYSLGRYAFKGDKLVSSTQKEYLGKPGAAAYR